MECGHVGMMDGSGNPVVVLRVSPPLCIINQSINDTIVDHLLLFCPHPLYLTYQCLAFRLLQSTVDY